MLLGDYFAPPPYRDHRGFSYSLCLTITDGLDTPRDKPAGLLDHRVTPQDSDSPKHPPASSADE